MHLFFSDYNLKELIPDFYQYCINGLVKWYLMRDIALQIT